MTFTTLTFFLFLPVIFTVYWLLDWVFDRQDAAKVRSQNILLIGASYVFYGWWDWRFCLLMLASTWIDYGAGVGLHFSRRKSARQLCLLISLSTNLGLLGFFKYCNFFAENLQNAAAMVGWRFDDVTLQIILPVGISFYTFQTLSYTIDIYRGKLQPTLNVIDYFAFVSFFPQLVAGPIERASHLLPQFASPRTFSSAGAGEACRLILWGCCKKLIVADRLAIIVNDIYATPEAFAGPHLALATICFAFQIYCDFSAYSDIAVGVARLFGFQLMRNFAYPYFSASVGEFWRRWHISLSTWFRDYVYIPLGGGAQSKVRRAVNVIITFLVSGLWHGAAWRFVAWGGMNGVATAVAPGEKKRIDEITPGGERFIPTPITVAKMLLTFCAICTFWVFFRASDCTAAAGILLSIAHDVFSIAAYQSLQAWISSDSKIANTLLILLLFVAWEWTQRRQECPLTLRSALPVRWLAYTAIFWGLFLLTPSQGSQDFIYFAF